MKGRTDSPALLRYGYAVAAIAAASLLRLAQLAAIGNKNTYLIFALAVIFSAWYGGIGPALLSIALGVAAAEWLRHGDLLGRPGSFALVMLVIAWAFETERRARRRLASEMAQRRQAEDNEERQRQWSETTLASIGDAVITTDRAGCINFMNRVAEELTGWSMAEAAGRPSSEVFRIVNEETGQAADNPIDRVLREGITLGLANHTALITRDGRRVPIDDSGAPVRNTRQEILGAVLVFRDFTERRRALREIRDSRQRLEQALEAGHMGAWEWEIGSGRVRWSANLERIHGLAPGTFGGTVADFERDVHPEDRERVRAAIAHALDTREDYRIEYRILRPDGSQAWLEARGSLVLDAAGAPERMTGICMDATARNLAEQELRRRLDQQSAVARLGALALSSRNLQDLLRKAVEVVATQLGVEYSSVLEALPQEQGLVIRAAYGWPYPREGETAGSGDKSQAGYTLLRGEPVVVESYDSSGPFATSPELVRIGVASGITVVIPGEERPFGVLSAFAARQRAFTPNDTQFVQAVANIVANSIRRQREEEGRARLAAILEYSEDAIVGKNLDGTVASWNGGAERVYGYTAAEMIGRPISRLLPPDRPDEETRILDRIRSGERVAPFETVRVRKDGAQIQVSLTISPVRDSAGQVIGASHIARDITERKLVEEKLQQTQKLESLGILAGGIAHDFNNLLTGILGNASLITEMVTASSPARELAESVIRAAERAAHLTRQMLAYSGRGRFLIQPTDCSRQVREIAALIAASIPKNVQVRLLLSDALPAIEADTGQLQQLLMNLIINGAEAIGRSAGTVTILTRMHEIDPAYIAGMTFAGDLKPGRYVCLEVRDSGAGMDAATLGRVFDPFFTTKFTGRGLGLAAVLGIVRGHGGGVHVRSSPGAGTIFQVLFPPAARQEKEQEAPPPAPPRHRHRILVVDDEALVRNAARVGLEKYGYSVAVAENGQRAVEIFREEGANIAAVLLDMTMPGLSGEETFRALHALRPEVPVIVSSGYGEAEAVERFGPQIAGFVQKPYSARQLAARLAAALEGREYARSGGAG